MGIRFYCPNGHKLNVKAFLAGKRGICPHCDVRFDIPFESQIPENAPRLRPHTDDPHTDDPHTDDPHTDDPHTEDRGPLVNGAVNGATSSLLESHSSAATPLALATQVALENEAIAAEIADPIAEAPEAVWYVRPPAGGQFGPARGELMRQWLAEGRVSPECLVWREGWTDWRSAGLLFPDLRADPPPPSPERTPVVEPLPNLATESEQIRDAIRVRRQSAGKGKSIAAVVFLGLLIVVLLVMLVFVLLQSA